MAPRVAKGRAKPFGATGRAQASVNSAASEAAGLPRTSATEMGTDRCARSRCHVLITRTLQRVRGTRNALFHTVLKNELPSCL